MWNYSDNEFIKIYRKLLNWEWYTDVNTKVLFLHCLLKANWKAGRWKGYKYERGQFITSLPKLAKETGLTVMQVRTALKHLKMTGELTDKIYSKFRIITVVGYDEYQQVNRQSNRQVTDNQQASNRQVTADIRTYKNIKENKEEYRPSDSPEDEGNPWPDDVWED